MVIRVVPFQEVSFVGSVTCLLELEERMQETVRNLNQLSSKVSVPRDLFGQS